MTDSCINLYKLLGISDERFEKIISPHMNTLCSKGMPADAALLATESNNFLAAHEKLYCAYAIGRACGIEEMKAKARIFAKRLFK